MKKAIKRKKHKKSSTINKLIAFHIIERGIMEMNLKTKKIISSLLIAANMAIPANITLAKEESKTHKEISVYFNDEQITFDQQPVIVDGRTKVPFRAIFETMGTVVYYRASDSSILGLTRDGDTIHHVVGTNKATINGEEKTYDSISEIINDRTLIPVRMVADLLSAEVEWNETKQTINIEKDIEINAFHEKIRGIMGCVVDKNFNPEDFKRYIDYQCKNWNMDPKQVIIDVNMDLDRELVLIEDEEYSYLGLKHYGPKKEDIEIVKNPHDPLVFLNKFNRLPDGFEPTNLDNFYDMESLLSNKEGAISDTSIRIMYGDLRMKKEIISLIKQMLVENQEHLQKIISEESYDIGSAYITPEDVSKYFMLNVNTREDDTYQRLRFDVVPELYHSDLHTGYSFTYLFGHSPHMNSDVSYFNSTRLGLQYFPMVDNWTYYANPELSKDLRTYEQFEWLENNAYKYGFIQRYPEDKEHITRYLYQPQEYRYVGKDIAKIMHDNNWCFEEYYARYLVESDYKTDLESTKKKVLERY